MIKMKQTRLVLASASPRRKKLLQKIGLEFTVIPSGFTESSISSDDPVLKVKQTAAGKAEEVFNKSQQKFSGNSMLILAADTVIYFQGEITGKPQSERDAEAILKELSGKKHEVYTGIALLETDSGKELKDYEKTEVYFRELTNEEIRKYIATGEPMDKAGAYGIQERGAVFVKKIIGSYSNVVGLPVARLYLMFKQFSFPVL